MVQSKQKMLYFAQLINRKEVVYVGLLYIFKKNPYHELLGMGFFLCQSK